MTSLYLDAELMMMKQYETMMKNSLLSFNAAEITA